MDAGLNLFTGNRLEVLAMALSKVLEAPTGSPLEEDVVVLQSQGMARWLSLALSRNNGICANVRWRFPNAFLQDMFALAVPDLADTRRFDAKTAAWKIMGALPGWVTQSVFAPVAHFLGGDGDALKRYQISELLADTLDQYLTYRPDMIEEWERGEGDDFQAVLYRTLLEDLGFRHRVHLMKDFKEWVRTSGNNNGNIPERVCVFGISSLPEFHMELFTALSEVCQVNLFLLNPCPQYWGDILSDSEKRRLKEKQGLEQEEDETLLMEGGNPLLASMGGQGREFFDMMAERGLEEFPLFVEPDGVTLLGAVQADIFNLQDRSRGGGKPYALDPSDTSLTIHSCHSPLREVEVLRDAMLAMMDEDPDLKPSDILVMAPDINTYAPVIEAVFSRRVEGGIRIPFSIADQANRSGDRAVEALLLLLDLSGFRFEAGGVLELLENDRIRQAFAMEEGDLERVSGWIRETAVRWGVDGSQREAEGFSPFDGNSWKAGFDRLFTGYAVGDEELALYDGILPAGPVEGEHGALLGKLAWFLDSLTAYVKGLEQSRSAKAWVAFFDRVLETFLTDDEGAGEGLQGIRDCLYRMGDAAGEAENEDSVEFSVVRFILKTALAAPDPVSGFITSGVTFCAMLPMRSIPFRVIAILGMGHGTFPRQQKAPGFDLIAASPRRGDRSRRKDDRYLFLEILLSVRETLWVSYTGQSIRDNSTLQPSVLLSELLDYVDGVTRGAASEQILVTHPLHPFSSTYFQPGHPRLFTYDAASRRVAARMAEVPVSPPPFARLSDPDDELELPEALTLESLEAFFAHPCRYFLREGLGLELGGVEEAPESCEPFTLSGLDRYRAGTLLFEEALSGEAPEKSLGVVSGMGLLPRGEVGAHLLRELTREAGAVADAIAALVAGGDPLLERQWVEIAGVAVAGEVGPFFGENLVAGRFGKVRSQDLISAWLRLLVAAKAGMPVARAVVVGLDRKTGRAEVVSMVVPPNPGACLEDLIGLFAAGNGALLPLFPLASEAYARELAKSRDEGKAMAKASSAFYGNEFSMMADLNDPWIRMAVRGRDPLTEPAFARCAERLFRPMLEATE
ncbi:exodeoxyribonuclease V subunit gamma [Desulfoluna spongiiphila]|uniref:exodeoxyribonuclease V subunit gamma n=1 Tax=Desulfoluna spongiiphila TaxID=419481 RepID=UPI0012547B96|nr:exodeoxyribonuclease V subunit gamma [Desulfoluna spongiiphila]VVS95432.1 exodeoxyribonuclease v gamma subunit [Desulfoluna spongiiphila]